MKPWFYISVSAIAFACSSQPKDQIVSGDYVLQIEDCAAGSSFKTMIDTGGCRMKIFTIDHPTTQELVVHTDDGEKLLGELRRTVNGTVSQALSGDLNNDGNPELYVLSKESADSTALMAFEVLGDRFQEIEVPGHATNCTSSFQITDKNIIETTTTKNGDTKTVTFSLSPLGKLIRETA